MIGTTDSKGASDFDPSHPSNSVSVIIPVYNGAKYIAQTLDSILAQTLRPIEILVIDDDSPDNSADIVRGFGDAVTLIHTENGGASAARNLGASKATGNWLAFCDQDDLWHPTKLEKQIRLAHDCPDIHYVLTDYAEMTNGRLASRSHLSYAPSDFWTQEQHEYGFIVREPVTAKLTIFQPSITSTPIVNRDFYLDVGGFDLEAEWGAEDTCFHFRCLSVVPFGVVPEVLMFYNRHADAGSADPIKQMRKGIVVWEHIIAKYPQAQPYRAQLLSGLAEMRKELAQSERYEKRQKLKRLIGLA
jgi:glycosyltransferase involved in cell wall biosynthesis